MSSATTAVLLMAYGTPRHPHEVEAYYTDIRRGHPPTPEQLADLTRRYRAIGGLSPLAERTQAQRVGLQRALDQLAPGDYDVVVGLKHAAPTIEAAVADLAERGAARVVGLVLAPHYSALSVGQYLERASAAARSFGLDLRGIQSWHLEPALIGFLATGLRTQLATMPAGTKVLFTAHSLPARVLHGDDPYPTQLRETAKAVADRAGLNHGGHWARWATAWQSAGRTSEAWLGPDILAVIDELAASEGAEGVVVCPCGFVADHLEVLYDLDIEAAERASRHGLAFARTPCVNDDPDVLAALAARVHALAGA